MGANYNFSSDSVEVFELTVRRVEFPATKKKAKQKRDELDSLLRARHRIVWKNVSIKLKCTWFKCRI